LFRAGKSELDAGMLKVGVKIFNEISTYSLPKYKQQSNGQVIINTIYFEKMNDNGTLKKQ